MKLNKFLTVAVAGATVFTLVGCNSKTTNDIAKVEDVKQTEDIVLGGEDVQIANPWSDVSSLSEATSLAGFDMTVPETINNASVSVYRVIENEMLEVNYGDNITVRKSIGSEDNSGVYNEYETGGQLEVDDLIVNFKGIDENTANVVYWNNGNYTYSIYFSEGISIDIATETVSLIK